MSLVTTPTRSLAVCVHCASIRCTSLSMVLTDGTAVEFVSCHACEGKSWRTGGRELDVATVLVKATKHKVAKVAKVA